MNKEIFIIAEAGVNHNGDLDTALGLIDVAADCGADAVKFQSFVAGQLVTRNASQAEYQVANLGYDEGQLAMLERLQLSPGMHRTLVAHCLRRQIKFMSTAFDDLSIDLLRSIGCTPWKIPSGEITNLPYLRRIGAFGQETILSTGMATLGEVEAAVSVLEEAGTPRERIALLHCTTEYPAPFASVNLRAMVTLGQALGLRFGYSDHTPGIEIAIAAAAMGASVLEKHFTFDKAWPGPDHKASLDPVELRAMVRSVRNLELALGDGIKRPAPAERKNLASSRKSIVAALPIRAGEAFTRENLTTKRPGTGISPMRWDDFIGRNARRDYAPDELLDD